MKLRYFFGLWCILVALSLFTEPYFRQQNSIKTVTSNPFITNEVIEKPTKQLIAGKPIKIQIESINVDLTIIDGFYNPADQSWTLTKDKAQFASTTTPSNNQQGNTYIYGHNTETVFGNMFNIKAGDEAVIYTDSGHSFKYTFDSSYVTSPNDNSPLAYDGPSILTIQTCSGIWNENRQLFKFSFKEVI